MAKKVDTEKIAKLMANRDRLRELLEKNELTQEEIDKEMAWESKSQKTQTYKALRDNGYIPVDKDGKPWVCPIEDYHDYMESQKEQKLEESKPKKPKMKDPQGKRDRAEQAYVKAKNALVIALKNMEENPGEENSLKFIIADARCKLALLKLRQVKSAIAMAFDISLEEVDRMADLNNLLEEE